MGSRKPVAGKPSSTEPAGVEQSTRSTASNGRQAPNTKKRSPRIVSLHKIVMLLVGLAAAFYALNVHRAQPNQHARSSLFSLLKEDFLTPRDLVDNVDSLAVWHKDNNLNANGEPEPLHWVVATAKETNILLVYDANTGHLIKKFGVGENLFSRPNGIALLPGTDVVCVIERDNHRAQLLSLPDFKQIAIFGEDELRRPYGLAVYETEKKDISSTEQQRTYHIYITDNYIRDLDPAAKQRQKDPNLTEEERERIKLENRKAKIPPAHELGQRVRQYEVSLTINTKKPATARTNAVIGHTVDRVKSLRYFGDTAGPGVLHKVETIAVDPLYKRLLIADEFNEQNNVKIFTLDGKFTGHVMGSGIFEHEPEGIALYECNNTIAEGEGGYFVMTDQHKKENRFYIFSRKTFRHLGTFKGEVVANTDGVALTQHGFGNFPKGAFYAVHHDGSVGAFSWARIAESLGLQEECTL